MTINTSDFAIYLPAVNKEFAHRVTLELPPDRSFPKGFDLSDLAFWERKNKLFHYPYVLHSIGQYKVGSSINNGITQGGRTDRVLIGDSGGFQIGKGTLIGYEALRQGMSAEDAMDAWANADDVRSWIVSWLETHCQYAMTLDMPLWAATSFGSSSPFHKCSREQLTEMTVQNLRYIEMHRQGRAKWLNVVQGVDEQSTRDWWKSISWFRHGGWALAGAAGARGGIVQVLKTVLMMRDDDAFASGQDWVHVLGTSTLDWSVMLSAIQKCLRPINPNIKISFDSSSPFQIGGMLEEACILPELTDAKHSWVIRSAKSPQGHIFVGSNEPFPHQSAIGARLTLGNLNVYEGLYEKRRYDPISLSMLVHHNIWVYLNAMQRANEAAFGSNTAAQIPMIYRQCIEVINEAFITPNWNDYISKNLGVLEAVSRNQYK